MSLDYLYVVLAVCLFSYAPLLAIDFWYVGRKVYFYILSGVTIVGLFCLFSVDILIRVKDDYNMFFIAILSLTVVQYCKLRKVYIGRGN